MLMGLDLLPERPGEQWAASSHVWGVDVRWTLRGCPASVLGLGTLAGGWAQEDPQAPRGPPRSSTSPHDACTHAVRASQGPWAGTHLPSKCWQKF